MKSAHALSRREFAIVAVFWALVAATFAFMHRDAIAAMIMPDSDDYLRLQQVRDWLAGQGWFDVTQRRVNPPAGGMLHWSRIVDLPIAAGILTLTPLVGRANAELITATAIPFAIMGVAMLIVAAITARLVNRNWAPVAAACVPFSMLTYPQILPLRIDHHGWQLVLALTLMRALLDETHKRRSGVIAGLAAAAWLNISIEGLPIVTVAALLLGARWLFDPRELPRLQSYLWTLTLGSFALETVTMANAWTAIECDRMSAPYLAGFAAASVAVVGARSLKLLGDWRWRLGFAAFAGAVTAAAFASVGPACLGGPFANLDPLTRSLWLDQVGESRPLIGHGLGVFIACAGFSACALVGAALAVRASEGEARLRWITALALLAPATILMLVLARTGAVAHGFAGAGAAYLGMTLFQLARASAIMPLRAFGTVLALVAATPMLLLPALQLDAAPSGAQRACDANYDVLNVLPQSVLFTPLDMAPTVIVRTPHSVIATGHHRNHRAMADVIRTFTAEPAAAHAIIRAHGANYVVFCSDAIEVENYVEIAPDGFAAQLIQGRTPAWLRPVTLEGASADLLAFAVSEDSPPAPDMLRGRLAR